MIILGIETSCDETAAAVVVDGTQILSSIVSSQIDVHHPYGGVVPELASREHIRNIVPVVDESFLRAGIGPNDIDGVAVTVGPGLIGSLLVGLYYTKSFAYINNLPIAAINHLEGHILSIMLEGDAPEFPFVALTVSGGHTSLYHVKDIGVYKLMGQTLDDAAGEAFDKVARLLELGYPGGPAIQEKAEEGDPKAFDLPRAWLPGTYNFSFSGLKTAVLYLVRRLEREEKGLPLADLAASFQAAVADVLVEKTRLARSKLPFSHTMTVPPSVRKA